MGNISGTVKIYFWFLSGRTGSMFAAADFYFQLFSKNQSGYDDISRDWLCDSIFYRNFFHIRIKPEQRLWDDRARADLLSEFETDMVCQDDFVWLYGSSGVYHYDFGNCRKYLLGDLSDHDLSFGTLCVVQWNTAVCIYHAAGRKKRVPADRNCAVDQYFVAVSFKSSQMVYDHLFWHMADRPGSSCCILDQGDLKGVA